MLAASHFREIGQEIVVLFHFGDARAFAGERAGGADADAFAAAGAAFESAQG
jgi:hypothetical protein